MPGAGRRIVALYLCSGILGLQLLFALEQGLGLKLPLGPTGPMMTTGLPLLGTALGLWRGLLKRPQPRTPLRWLAVGLVLFATWAGGYFLLGLWMDPARVHTLDGRLEAALPFVPNTALVYLGVHPLFLLPFALLEEDAALARHAQAAAGVIGVCFAAWALFPVAIDRPVLDPALPGFGAYVFRTIQGSDPPINCLPSSHCAMALLSALSLRRTNRVLGPWLLVTAAAIGAATVLTRQHYVVDVVAGYALGAAAFILWHPHRSPRAE